jgi:very-short-patch-repair endonuclease
MAILTALARKNRKDSTDAENRLYYALKDAKIGKFQRQFPISNKYIVDLIWRERRFVIECDGGQHCTEQGLQYDAERDEFLQKQGYKLIRFGNDEIIKNINSVLYEICKELGIDYQL